MTHFAAAWPDLCSSRQCKIGKHQARRDRLAGLDTGRDATAGAGSGLPVSSEKALAASGIPRLARASVMFGVLLQEPMMACSSCEAVASGLACSSSAHTPAICGVAIEVPSISANLPPGTQDRTPTPGATRSGTSGSAARLNFWLPENQATLSSASLAPTERTVA